MLDEDRAKNPSGQHIGQHVGNYRIVRKLGEGGMGVVFEGIHEQIGRRVAIKVLHPELSRHADTVSRFLTEARLVSMLQHPGVVYTFEYGQLPDQTAYIIMEYLQGESLAKRLKASGGRLGSAAVNVGRQVASALATAHAQGIVHREQLRLETATGKLKICFLGNAQGTGYKSHNQRCRPTAVHTRSS
jgi:serine/threonine protein kinase